MHPRPLLYERIDRRVEEMLKNGLGGGEVERLRGLGLHEGAGFHAGLGYKILAWLDGRSVTRKPWRS